MFYEKQPSRINIGNQLKNVLTDSISREEFNRWSHKWIQNFDSRNQLSSTEYEIHEYLIFLLAIDLEIEPAVYFHNNEELAEWIEKIKKG